jgi:hypothetical protein
MGLDAVRFAWEIHHHSAVARRLRLLEFDGRQYVAIDVEPLALFADEARSFVQLFHFSGGKTHDLGIPKFRDEFHHPGFVLGLAFLGFEYRELDPLSLVDGLAVAAFVVGAVGLGMEGGDQVVDVATCEGSVARSHQGLGSGCRDGAAEIGFTAIGVGIVTTARAKSR